MIRLGIVYEIHSNKAVVLTPDSEFLVIKRTRDMCVGQQVKFSIQDVRKTMKPIYKHASIASGVAAVFILVFMFFRFLPYNNVYGYINVDINPSIEFSVDNKFEVLKTRALNDDAKVIVKELNAKGRNVYDVITEFVDKSENHGFINKKEKNVVLVSASLNDKNSQNVSNEEKDLDAFLFKVNKKMNSENAKYITSKVIKVSPGEREAAAKNNLSMGKYYLMEKAQESGLKLSVEDLNKEKILDILTAIDENDNVVLTSDAAKNTKQEDKLSTGKFQTKPTKDAGKTIKTPSVKPAAKPTAKPPVSETFIPTVKPTVKPPVKPTEEKYAISDPTPSVQVKVPVEETKNDTGAVENANLKVRLNSVEKRDNCKIVCSKIQVVNTGKTKIDLTKVKVRYYFTKEGNSELESAVYSYSKGSIANKNFFEQKSTGEVVISFHEHEGSEMYMEIGFTSGVLKPNEYAYTMVAFNNEDWSEFEQNNDYSYKYEGDSMKEWVKVPGYISDSLVWGMEP